MSLAFFSGIFGTAAVMWGGWLIRAWLDGTLKVKLRLPDAIQPAAELAVHILAGSALFALVFSAAAALNYLIDFFVIQHIAPNWLIWPTHILEAIVWGGDAIAFLLFTIVQLIHFCRNIVRPSGHGATGRDVDATSPRSTAQQSERATPDQTELRQLRSRENSGDRAGTDEH